MGAKGRLGVIIVSLVLASPFAAGGLYFKHSVPFGFLSGIPTMRKMICIGSMSSFPYRR